MMITKVFLSDTKVFLSAKKNCPNHDKTLYNVAMVLMMSRDTKVFLSAKKNCPNHDKTLYK